MCAAFGTHRAACTSLVPRSKARFVPEVLNVFCMLSVSHVLLCVWPFASVMLQARSRLHVRRPGSRQLQVLSNWLQVLFKLSVSCCQRPGPGCTGGKRVQVCTLSKTVLHARLSDLPSMSLQLCDMYQGSTRNGFGSNVRQMSSET